MSNYFALPSVECIYFTKDYLVYKMQGSQPIFREPTHLQDVDELWVKKLSENDKKLLEKDLKKFKKI